MFNITEGLQDLVKKLENSLFQSSLSESGYDTSQLLKNIYIYKDVFNEKQPASKAIRLIIDNQQADGSWSSAPSVDFTQDKIINTLSNLIALKKHQQLQPRIEKPATNFLTKAIPNSLKFEMKSLIGFKLNLYRLLDEYATKALDSFKNNIKPAKMNLDAVYTQRTTKTSLLDILSFENIDWKSITQVQEDNGSFGIYPSSTISFLLHYNNNDEYRGKALDYLKNIITDLGYLPAFYPSEIFEKYWAYYYIAFSPLRNELRNQKPLSIAVPTEGLAVSKKFSLPDSDTTAMVVIVKMLLEQTEDLNLNFQKFFKNNVFICYENETRTSASANIHILLALLLSSIQEIPDFEVMFYGALEYIINLYNKDGNFINDKWHLSDLYVNSHVVEFIHILKKQIWIDKKYISKMSQIETNLVTWIKDSKKDGCWGTYSPNVEETCYALRSLYYSSNGNIDGIITSHTLDLLSDPNYTLPPLWLGKTLYASKYITDALRLSTLSIINELHPTI